MPLQGTSTDSSSSSSSSSSSEPELSDHPTHHILDSPRQPNVQHIVKYFTDAQGRYRSFREQKTWQKLHLALVDARLAVLRTKWTDLLKAVKAVSDALSFSPAGLKLEWRAPILDRLLADIKLMVPLAMQMKRNLPANEAKSLSILKQRLSKSHGLWPSLSETSSKQNPFIDEATHWSDRIILDCLEMASLLPSSSSNRHVLPLNDLSLGEVPELLQDLPAIANWYESFGGLEGTAHTFDTLDLRHNNISRLPPWLPKALPRLRCLCISNNSMTVHPAITAFQDLELLDMNRQVLKSNAEDLVKKARQAIQANSYKAYIPPLALLCIERLRQDGYGMSESTRHLQANRYTCANCKETIWSEDPRSIPTPLRERYYHFDPPIAALRSDGRLPAGTSKMTRELTDSEWQFCAPCLIVHCTGQQEDDHGCHCIACNATRKMWQDRKVIRWFKLPVAL